ncbi:MAG: hypothetical protein GY901_09770 [Actinomycetia bacterium]|nr:hypothetical protein [Actinomycetes bacterium]
MTKSSGAAVSHDGGDCSRCHDPHRGPPGTMQNLECQGCHTRGGTKGSPLVSPREGHDTCTDCHQGGGHGV